MKIRFILLFLLVGFCTQLFAQRSDKNTLPAMNGGVVYSLPRTGIRIHVTASREKLFAGPYAQFAEPMLGLKNAPIADRERWTIAGIEFETFSEPDPERIYKAKSYASALVDLTVDGIIAGINSPAATGAPVAPVTTFLENQPLPEFPFKDLSLNPFFEKPDSTTRKVVIVAKTLQQKAQEAAHTVTKLRKRRFLTLANGYDEQLPDGMAYKTMVEELGKLEDEYVALFIGKTYSETYHYTFDFIPGDNSVSGEVVFRFSDTKGVLPKTDLSGKPMQIDLKKLDDLAVSQEKQKAVQAASPATNSVYYRMPGKAELRLMNGVNLMAFTRLDIAQFGTVMPVPEELLEGNHRIQFHPSTGAIKSISTK